MRRPCARPTCSFPATASVLIDLTGHTAELVDLAEPALGHHHLCGRHAASTSVPLGWTLVDARSPEFPLWAELPDQIDEIDQRTSSKAPAAPSEGSAQTGRVRVLFPDGDAASLRADTGDPLPFAPAAETAGSRVDASPVESDAVGPDGVGPDAVDVFARYADLDESTALGAALAAATPLLNRAFSEVRAS